MSLPVETKGGLLAAGNVAGDDPSDFTPPTKRGRNIKDLNYC